MIAFGDGSSRSLKRKTMVWMNPSVGCALKFVLGHPRWQAIDNALHGW